MSVLMNDRFMFGTPAAATLYQQPGMFADAMARAQQGNAAAVGQTAAAQGAAMQGLAAGIGQLGGAASNAMQGFTGGLGQLAGSQANAFTGYSQGLGGLGNAFAGAFGAYGSGLGSIANARANENSARYSSAAMSEAARQAAMANIGAAGLGAYGSAANSALAAWANNQQSYNNALAAMHSADQGALANYGSSRNAAVGQYGSALANALAQQSAALGGMTTGLGTAARQESSASDVTGDFGGSLGGGGGGGGFTAMGPDGPIASGSYGGTYAGGDSLTGAVGGRKRSFAGPGPEFAGIADRGFGQMGAMRDGLLGTQREAYGSLMSPGITDDMRDRSRTAAGRLDSQHLTSRGMPSEMLGQTLSGLMTMQSPAYAGLRDGMNQFYANTQRDDRPYGAMLGALTGGLANTNSQLRGVQGQLGAGYGSVTRQLADMRDPMSAAYDQALRQIGQGQAQLGSGFSSSIGAMSRGLDSMQSRDGVGALAAFWDRTLGASPEFQSPQQREIARRAGEAEKRRTRDMSQLDHLTRLAQNAGGGRLTYLNRRMEALRGMI